MKRLICGGLAALAIGLTACSATGGAGSAPTSSPTYATYATSTIAPTPVRVTPPGIGVTVTSPAVATSRSAMERRQRNARVVHAWKRPHHRVLAAVPELPATMAVGRDLFRYPGMGNHRETLMNEIAR